MSPNFGCLNSYLSLVKKSILVFSAIFVKFGKILETNYLDTHVKAIV